MPVIRHNIHNKVEHPNGNAPGVGLTKEQRSMFDIWRNGYWKERVAEELARRGIRYE